MPARPSHIPTYFERLGLEATIKVSRSPAKSVPALWSKCSRRAGSNRRGQTENIGSQRLGSMRWSARFHPKA